MMTTKIKIIFIALVLVMAAGTANAQIPVTDTASISTQGFHFIETMLRWKEQYDQMFNQLNQMEQQYNSLTGSRGLGGIFNNPELRDYLPKDWRESYNKVMASGYSGLKGRAKEIYDSNKYFDACAYIENLGDRRFCEAQAVKPALEKAFVEEIYAKSRKRLDNIDELMKQIDKTQDPKAIAELQSRIASEQATIEAQRTVLQVYYSNMEVDDRLNMQRQREINARTWSSSEGIKAKPLKFNRP